MNLRPTLPVLLETQTSQLVLFIFIYWNCYHSARLGMRCLLLNTYGNKYPYGLKQHCRMSRLLLLAWLAMLARISHRFSLRRPGLPSLATQKTLIIQLIYSLISVYGSSGLSGGGCTCGNV